MTEKLWRSTLYLSALFHLLHFIALPLLLTVDGADYILMGRLAARFNFGSEYYFARPPLYPLLLEASTRLLGRNALALQFPNLLLGFGGICLAGACIWRIGFPRLAAVTVLLLTFCPTLVAYEHCVLTEIGSVFWIFLILWLLLKSMDGKHPWFWTFAIGLALGLSYYHRPTLFYLAPVWGLLRAASTRMTAQTKSKCTTSTLVDIYNIKTICKYGKCTFLHSAAVIVIGWSLALPWQIALAHSNERYAGNEQLLTGLLKQAVMPPEDPLVDDIRKEYALGIAEATKGGSFDVAGIHQYTLWKFSDIVVKQHRESGTQIFFSTIFSHPQRYFAGVWRTLLLFSGYPSSDDENEHFTNLVIHDVDAGGKILAQIRHLQPELEYDFAQRTNNTHISRTLDSLRTFFKTLIPIGALLTLLAFMLGIWKSSVSLLLVSMPALAFIFMHAFALIASTRYVLPVYPLLLLNVFLIPMLLWRIFRTSEAAST